MTEESVNNWRNLCLSVAFCVVLLSVPLSSQTVSADENLILYTNYYQYDNNESLDYHIIGTNNTTYTLVILHRDFETPLRITYRRTGVNETMLNGTIPLHELTVFGSMELRAFNKSYNQSAKTEFRLVPSQVWWKEYVDESDARTWAMILNLLWIIGTAYAIPTFIGVALLISYRDKAKAASGELTISERMSMEDIWNYDDYANDVCARNPHSPSERARLKYSTARSLFFQVHAAKKKMGVYRQLEEKEKELSARLPGLVNDVLDALVNEGVITKKERKDMSAGDRFRLLNPGQKKVEL